MDNLAKKEKPDLALSDAERAQVNAALNALNVALDALKSYAENVALAVLKPYIEDHPEMTLEEALKAFEQVEGKKAAEAVARGLAVAKFSVPRLGF